jgi:hypothetical protein
MNKKLLILLAIALVILPVASCGRTAVTGKPLAQPVPHAVDVRFADCLACHVTDQLNAKPLPHTDPNTGKSYTNADCTKAGCHKVSGATTPPTSTTPPSSTPTGTGTSSTPPVSSKPAATLPDKAIAITTHSAAVLTSYKGLCQMCHGPGTTNSNPYPPTWDGKANGSTANTGVYTIAAGSTQDHSQYTVDQCTQAGCHTAPTS